jgi:ribosome-associated protein
MSEGDQQASLEAALDLVREQAIFRSSRSSGPGGQHAQRNETRVEAVFDIEASSLEEPARTILRARYGSAVRAVSQDERSQLRNRELARERLLEKVREALTPVAERRPTRPSRQARLARLFEKRRRSLAKQLRRPPAADD